MRPLKHPHKLSNGRHGGWRPDRPKSTKDWHIDRLLGAPKSGALTNKGVDPSYYPLLKDQKALGSCTGESLTYGLEEEVIRVKAEAGEDVKSDWWLKWKGLSGLAAYYFSRTKQGTPNEDSGSEIRYTVDAAREFGVPNETDWPYIVSKFRLKPTATAMKSALWHKPDDIQTYRCDGRGGSREETLTNIFRAFDAKRPVNLGFACPLNWGNYDNDGRIPLPGGQYDGGHAIIGFKRNEDNDIMGPNTWGDQIGAPQPQGARVVTRGGRGWYILPKEYILNGDADDAWLINLKI